MNDNNNLPVFLTLADFVQPVEFETADLSAGARITLFLQRDPGRTTREIAAALSMPENTVRTALFRLAVEGEVRKIPRTEGERRSRWEVGEDDSYVRREKPVLAFKRSTVSEWEPETRRDVMVEALFGPAGKP